MERMTSIKKKNRVILNEKDTMQCTDTLAAKSKITQQLHDIYTCFSRTHSTHSHISLDMHAMVLW